jgi:hypothetical protein
MQNRVKMVPSKSSAENSPVMLAQCLLRQAKFFGQQIKVARIAWPSHCGGQFKVVAHLQPTQSHGAHGPCTHAFGCGLPADGL